MTFDRSDGVLTASTSTDPVRMVVDHPGWLTPTPGRFERAFRWGHRTWVINCCAVGARLEPTAEVVNPSEAAGTVAASRLVEVFDPAALPEPFRSVAQIRECGRVQRLRNPDLWDALLLPILQHRCRRSDAVGMYRRLCSALGEKIRTTRSAVFLPPRPETVVGLDDAAFDKADLLPGADRLRTIAAAYLEHGAIWLQLGPADLFVALQQARYVGAWTAAAAVADLTNDFSFYPPPEFATQGRWDQFSQESNDTRTPREFQTAWEHMSRAQKSVLTVLSIDWKSRHPLRRDEPPLVKPPTEQKPAPPTSPWEAFLSPTPELADPFWSNIQRGDNHR
jgi:DNA-3-methyladenine glycosylase II